MQTIVQMLKKEWLEKKIVINIALFFSILATVLSGYLIFKLGTADIMISTILDNRAGDDFQLCVIDNEERPLDQCLTLVIDPFVAMFSALLSIYFFSLTYRKPKDDGSAVFWSSMPISSLKDHLVKFAFGLMVIPVVCSLLVLIANVSVWLVGLFVELPTGFWGGNALSITGLLFSVPAFWLKMMLSGVMLLPLAAIMMALSQVFRHPFIFLLIKVAILELIFVKFLNVELVGSFMQSLVTAIFLPFTISFSESDAFISNINVMDIIFYFLMGAVAFLISLHFNRTVDVEVFYRKART
ncbi:hypothetical protein [Veronia pacifica]|uniref:Uncharacterized protein n=1 Tax=Veronia pacifica TaxID=1080227 RepID=A0A1C3EJ72_9GAMM|nr:hypothetical protein [Veronia pacifica]ODA33291.1 hypothetical protein A8L45_10855 [Veronia pacifica]